MLLKSKISASWCGIGHWKIVYDVSYQTDVIPMVHLRHFIIVSCRVTLIQLHWDFSPLISDKTYKKRQVKNIIGVEDWILCGLGNPVNWKKHYRKKLQVHVLLSKEHWHKKSAWHKIDCGCLSSAFSRNLKDWKTSSKCQPELVGEFISEPDSLLCSVWWLGLNASIW